MITDCRINRINGTHSVDQIYWHILLCVCADDGWLQQPHLARVTLIGLWGWVSNKRAQVKPDIPTHTLRKHFTPSVCIIILNLNNQLVGSISTMHPLKNVGFGHMSGI